MDGAETHAMNGIALRYAVSVLAVVLFSLLLVLALRREHLARVKSAINWLLKVSFFDFVEMVIFIRPWKAYVEPTGIVIWLILGFVVGRYMITVNPKITEIPGPYIPAIGYVYLVSILVIMRAMLRVMSRRD
jgi:hypothetical protein